VREFRSYLVYIQTKSILSYFKSQAIVTRRDAILCYTVHLDDVKSKLQAWTSHYILFTARTSEGREYQLHYQSYYLSGKVNFLSKTLLPTAMTTPTINLSSSYVNINAKNKRIIEKSLPFRSAVIGQITISQLFFFSVHDHYSTIEESKFLKNTYSSLV